MRIGVVGAGHWGAQYIRNFSQIDGVSLVGVLDTQMSILNKLKPFHPIELHTVLDDFLNLELDAVVIATPASTHFDLALTFINQGIHCLIEKPLCFLEEQCLELIQQAHLHQVQLMVGHTLLFSPEVQYLKTKIQKGHLGNILSVNTQRLNLGRVQKDCDVLWDLAPHDLSVLLYLMESPVTQVYTQGKSQIQPGRIDLASLQLEFENGAMANMLFSWMDPRKTRLMTFVGDEKMAVFDDCHPSESLKIFDKRIEESTSSDGPHYHYHEGEILIPEIPKMENLRNLCLNFVDIIHQRAPHISNADSGLEITRIIQAAHESLKLNGQGVSITKKRYQEI